MARKPKYILPPTLKYCPKCRTVKGIGEFNPSVGYCKPCEYLYHKDWVGKNGDYTSKLFREALEMYGSACSECGESDPELLKVHPFGRSGVRTLLHSLRAQGWPPTHRLLCVSCITKFKSRKVKNAGI